MKKADELIKLSDDLSWLCERLIALPEAHKEAAVAALTCQMTQLIVLELAKHLYDGVDPYDALLNAAYGTMPMPSNPGVHAAFEEAMQSLQKTAQLSLEPTLHSESKNGIPMENQIMPTINVPDFNLTAPALREAIDQIADSAMAGLERITHAMANVPAEMHPLLSDLRALFGSIGHQADATADDVGIDLDQVWGVGVARAGNHEMVVANSPTFDKPEAA